MDEDLEVSSQAEDISRRAVRHTAILGVALLHVAQALDEHLDWDVLVVGEQVALCAVARKVDERVGIRRDTSEAGEDIAECQLGEHE